MKAADYDRHDLQRALRKLDIGRGDVVFSHSNLGLFGRPAGVGNGQELCALFAEVIQEAIGPSGTLVVPTFTYSFPRKEIFDVENSRSAMGLFAEWIRSHPDSQRSQDPCYSVSAIGGSAHALTKLAPVNSFGPGCFFERFHEANGKVLNLNFDAGSTFVHYVERCLGVPYRFDKHFEGRVRIKGQERAAENTIFVRYLSDDALAAAFEPLDRLAREKELVRTATLGRGEILVFAAEDIYGLIAATLPMRPWFLTRAEQLGVVEPNIVPEDGA